jgi:NFU1 iron-sulfur cluster scaffold homolog, mitochondrial
MSREPDIQAIGTPNPRSVKFLTDRTLLATGSAEFPDPESTQRSPLAHRLFDLDGVEGVFLCQNFVTVTAADDSMWSRLTPAITDALKSFLESGEEIVRVVAPSEDSENLDELESRIKNILDTQIRPAVAMDGGDVVFVSFEHGVVSLKMQGACGGCPSAAMTLKQGIESRLRHFVPEVRSVEAV